MSVVTVMGWNLENFGSTKYKTVNGGPELIALIAKVMTQNNIDVAGFCEIRSNLGDDIGQALVTQLGGTAAGWTHRPSPAFGKGRWEQYLFVWNTLKVTAYRAGGLPAFESSFPNTSPPPANLGFPRQSQLDRPPFLAYFQTVTVTAPQKQVLVAIMHSPAPTPTTRPRDAARNIAKAGAITRDGDTCVLLGDFNVKESVDASVAGTPGFEAFGALVAAGFRQELRANVLSSLIPKAWADMNSDDCKSAPYDQLFCRRAAGLFSRMERLRI
jgi:hypothetical protein